MGKYNFDAQRDMKNQGTYKWDKEGELYAYPMGCADTDFLPPSEITDAIVKRATVGNLAYGVKTPAFAQSVVHWYEKRHNVAIKEDWVTFSPGLILALKMFLEAMTQVGDNVIIQSPVYNNFNVIINRNGRNVIKNKLINTNGVYTIDFEDLEQKAADPRTTMMILCNPHNPVSKEWSVEELRKIAEICHKHDVFVVSDECHSDILYNGTKHTPYISIDKELCDNSATINAGGKTFNTNGLYVAYVIAPNKNIKDKFELAYARHHFDFNMLAGNAHIAAYEKCDTYVDEMNEYLWENVKFVEGFLKENMPEVILSPVDSTFLLWLDFRNWNMKSKEIDDLFKSGGVALNRGDTYDSYCDGFMRVNIGCTHQVLKEAFDIILEKYNQQVKPHIS